MMFFGQREKIAGLAISQESIGLLLVKPNKGGGSRVEYIKERPLEEGVIQNGMVHNPDLFKKALKEVVPRRIVSRWREPRKVILSLPEELVHYETLLVSNTLNAEQLENSIVSHLEKNSPFPLEDIIYDWEEYPYSEKQKLILAAFLEKEKTSAYLETIQDTGLYAVALEGEFLSIRRFLGTKEGITRALVLVRPSKITSVILVDNMPSFSRSVPWRGNAQDIKKEVIKILEYYISEHPKGPAVKELIFVASENQRSATKTAQEELGRSLKIEVGWLQAPGAETTNPALLGSSLRGLVPRSKDKFISLMSPGTEELFHETQVLLFSRIVNDFLVIVSVILVIIFSLASFYILPNFSRQKSAQIEIKRAQPATKEIEELEEKVTEFNALVEPLAAIEQNTPDWILPLTDVTIRIRPGIHVNSVSMGKASNTVQIGGTADDIGFLLDFKSALSFSGIYSADLTIPFSSFEKEKDVPFSYGLILKDTSILFPLK